MKRGKKEKKGETSISNSFNSFMAKVNFEN